MGWLNTRPARRTQNFKGNSRSLRHCEDSVEDEACFRHSTLEVQYMLSNTPSAYNLGDEVESTSSRKESMPVHQGGAFPKIGSLKACGAASPKVPCEAPGLQDIVCNYLGCSWTFRMWHLVGGPWRDIVTLVPSFCFLAHGVLQVTFLSWYATQRPEAFRSQTRTFRTKQTFSEFKCRSHFAIVAGSHCCYSSDVCSSVLQKKISLSHRGALASAGKDTNSYVKVVGRREELRKAWFIQSKKLE